MQSHSFLNNSLPINNSTNSCLDSLSDDAVPPESLHKLICEFYKMEATKDAQSVLEAFLIWLKEDM